MAKVSELRAGQGKVDIEIVVKSKSEERTFNKYGRDLRVANAVVADESGEISLSLWNDDIDKINVGNKAKITNGYVSEFNGQKQLTSGKFGKIEVVSSDSSSAGESEDIKEEDSKKAKGKKASKEDKEPKQDSEEPPAEMSEEVEF